LKSVVNFFGLRVSPTSATRAFENKMRIYSTSVLPALILLLFIQSAAYCGLKESNYDKDREKKQEELHKDLDQIRMQKMRDEAREKRDKQLDEIRRINREEWLLRHPNEFYNSKVMGHYALKDGKPVPLTRIEGKVYDILDEKRILIYIPPPQQAADGVAKSSTLVMVVLEKAQKISKADKFYIPNTVEAGTYGYTKPDGTTVIVKQFKEVPGITLKEFLQLKKDGYRFPEESSIQP